MTDAIDINPSSRTIEVQKDTAVSKVIGSMNKVGAEEALVFEGKDFMGLFSHFRMLRSRANPARDKAERFVIPATRLAPDTSVLKAAEQMQDSSIRALPVFKGDKLHKTIDVYGVMDALKKESLDAPASVAMSLIDTVEESVGLGKALHMMHSRKVREMLVSDKDGEVIGVVSSKSVLENYHLHHTAERQHAEVPDSPDKTTQTEVKDLLDMPVRNFMEESYRTLESGMTLSGAIAAFADAAVPMLVETDDGVPVGILRAEETIKKALENLSGEVWNIHFVGLDNIGWRTADSIKEYCSKKGDKMYNHFKNEFEITVHIKEKEQTGKQRRYEVHSRLSYPGSTLSSFSDDWDLMTAVRKTMEKIENQLKSKYKDRTLEYPEMHYKAAEGEEHA